MDDLDYRLVALLRQDSRLPVASLAAALKVSRATVKARIDRLVQNGTIEAFTIRLGAELRQAEVRAIVLIEVEGKAADHVAQRLRGVPEVRALYSTNGRWDFVAELEDRDLAAFDETLRRLRLVDGIRSTETNILLNARKRATG
jgi:DNA-binding Lrp family transcriptional regulator